MIEVVSLEKKYGNHTAVDNLSFMVETGKVVGFLGPNGAGKSTTMNMITGYIAPTKGTVKINGIDIMEEPEKAKKQIGYLPEIPPLYPDLRVREYLKFVAELKKVPKAKRAEAVQSVMERTKISEVSERLIKHLSKGYKQRVGFAAALVGNPDILILDEPTVGLDPSQIIEIRELILELSKEHTILLSSHIMQEISAVCDEIIIINEGKMITKDTPEHLVSQISGNSELCLLVKGSQEVIEEALASIEGIENLIFEEKKEDGIQAVRISYVETKDIREEVFYCLAGVQCPILEMYKTDSTLEDVFLKLTKEAVEPEEKASKEKQKAVKSEKDAFNMEQREFDGMQNEFEGEQEEQNDDSDL